MRQNENGFSVVEILLVIVVVTVVGLSGWFVFNRTNPETVETSSKDSSTAKLSENVAETKDTAVSEEEGATTTFAIAELGISIELKQDIQDLVYSMSSENGISYANFSTKSLLALDSGCTSERGALGAFGKIPGQYNSSTAPGKLVKQFAEFHIVHTPKQGCPKGFEPNVHELFGKQSAAIQADFTYSTLKEL